MPENKEFLMALTLGALIYLFLEVFVTFILYINAVVFLKWKNLTSVLFWIITYLSILFGVVAQDNMNPNIILIRY